MFGPRLTSVFKSRWHALLWAGFVMLTAYCTVPAKDEQGSAEEVAALIAASKHEKPPAPPPANPWAKEGK
jgi:hypothetical protein